MGFLYLPAYFDNRKWKLRVGGLIYWETQGDRIKGHPALMLLLSI